MILTNQDLLKTSKYLECCKCKKVRKKGQLHYDPNDINRVDPYCSRCYRNRGTFRAFKKAELEIIHLRPNYHYTFLFNKYIKSGLSVEQAKQRINRLKNSSHQAHIIEKSKQIKSTFKEEFNKLKEKNDTKL